MASNVFVTVGTNFGPMIVSRLDFHPTNGFGVGAQLLTTKQYEFDEVIRFSALVQSLSKQLDRSITITYGGANIGAVVIPLVHMVGKQCIDTVYAIEAQHVLYMALCGNVMINNVWDTVLPIHGYLGKVDTRINTINYEQPGSLGSVGVVHEDSGVSYNTTLTTLPSKEVSIKDDTDLLYLDIEGAEFSVLETELQHHLPYIIVCEWIKSDKLTLTSLLESYNYSVEEVGMNLVAKSGVLE